jgi:hypothetical protein
VRTSEPLERSPASVSDADVIDLRLRYETAYDAYQACGVVTD